MKPFAWTFMCRRYVPSIAVANIRLALQKNKDSPVMTGKNQQKNNRTMLSTCLQNTCHKPRSANKTRKNNKTVTLLPISNKERPPS
ncbi:hypothetical protein, partial [Chromobacterium piscinae]|uniref:hypothetical protein n=1 Tax=Chromobacterium piscinae TaxID=686831 RepID=UPI003209CF19